MLPRQHRPMPRLMFEIGTMRSQCINDMRYVVAFKVNKIVTEYKLHLLFSIIFDEYEHSKSNTPCTAGSDL